MILIQHHTFNEYDMKKFFRKLAGYFVTAYANRLYNKAVKIADERHENEHTMIYVISSYTDASKLVTYNRKQFRATKEFLKLRSEKVGNMKQGSWYHTADAIERNGLSAKDREARRLAFVRMLLQRAGLA